MAFGYDELLMRLSKLLKGRGDVDLDARRGVSAYEDDTAYGLGIDRGKTLGTGRPKMVGAGEFLREKGKNYGDLNAEEIMAMFELDEGLVHDTMMGSPAREKAMTENPALRNMKELDKLRAILTPLLSNKQEFLQRRYYGNAVGPKGGYDIDTGRGYPNMGKTFE